MAALASPAAELGKTRHRTASVGALVTGADYRALGAVRSLGRRGIPVWVLIGAEHVLAATSRYAARGLHWPHGDEHSQAEFLMKLGAEHNLDGWVLLPTDDAAVALTSRYHDVLSKQYHVTVPPWEELRWVFDKRLLYSVARELGIAHPWTACPHTRRELASLPCPFPVVLKPAMRLELNRLTASKAWRVDDRQALLARYDEACTLVSPDMLMVQELIPGWGETQFSFAALCRKGEVLASVVAGRRRQYPMDFGRFSTWVETMDEPRVAEPAIRLLAALQFTGLAEVEFKKDPRDGQYNILDVNPRVWGWHTLSSRAGVDFPYLLWLLVHGQPISEAHGRPGERWMRMPMDLAMAFHEMRRGRLSLREYVKPLLGPVESAIFAWDDPLPGLLEMPLLAWTLAKRAFGGGAV